MKIEKCPFCGEEGLCSASELIEFAYTKYKVECCSCFCRTDLYDHPSIAIEAWNRRYKGD